MTATTLRFSPPPDASPEADVRAYAATVLDGLSLISDAPGACALSSLDMSLDGAMAHLADELRQIAGADRLRFVGPLEITSGDDGGFIVGGGATPTAARLLGEALDADPVFTALFRSCEARARALALGRMAVQAREALDATPDQAEVLWEWLCERGERTKTAVFRFTLCDGHGAASLSDAVGRPLGTWAADHAPSVAAE